MIDYFDHMKTREIEIWNKIWPTKILSGVRYYNACSMMIQIVPLEKKVLIDEITGTLLAKILALT